jgi:hypothetical protein
MTDTRKRDSKPTAKGPPLSLHPLSLDEALKGTIATGKPPEPVPHNKHRDEAAAEGSAS